MLEETNFDLRDVVVQLHYLARIVEQQVGQGNLTDDIRNCANRVNVLTKERVE